MTADDQVLTPEEQALVEQAADRISTATGCEHVRHVWVDYRWCRTHGASVSDGRCDFALDLARAVLPVVKAAQQETARAAWSEAHEIGWLNADEHWRCNGSIPAYHRGDHTPNPHDPEES